MANERAAMDDLRTILSTREPFYARADAAVDTSGRSVDSGASEILSVITSSSRAESEPKAGARAAQAKQVRTSKGRKSR